MRSFVQMENQGHEQIVVVRDSNAGLTAIIAIHSTVLGPALGGTRMYPYATEEQALRDVMELSRGMTYKAAAAGLPPFSPAAFGALAFFSPAAAGAPSAGAAAALIGFSFFGADFSSAMLVKD